MTGIQYPQTWRPLNMYVNEFDRLVNGRNHVQNAYELSLSLFLSLSLTLSKNQKGNDHITKVSKNGQEMTILKNLSEAVTRAKTQCYVFKTDNRLMQVKHITEY